MNKNISSQKFISKNRAPRVQIEYEVELYGSEKKIQLPFIMGVMANFYGNTNYNDNIEDRNFIEVNLENFNEVMESIKPNISFEIPDLVTQNRTLTVNLKFKNIDDFLPFSIVKNIIPLNKLLKFHTDLSNLLAYIDGKYVVEEWILSFLRKKIKEKETNTKIFNSNETKNYVKSELEKSWKDFKKIFYIKNENMHFLLKNSIKSLIKIILKYDKITISSTSFNTIQNLITLIDSELTKQINLIIHHPDFQKLESTWRGLHYLVSNTETSKMLKIRIFPISKYELSKNLKRYKGSSWDQSTIFKKIYEEEYGQFGGEPFGCLIGDYYFDHTPQDVEILEEMSKISASAHCPFISGVSPNLLQMNSWQELSNPRDLSKIFFNTEYIAWNMLRENEDSKYIGLVLPRILARVPYTKTQDLDTPFLFEEEIDNLNHKNYLWSNSAYAMGVNINKSFQKYGWCTSIRGVESGGLVNNLLCYSFKHNGSIETKCPTEIAISDRRESELSKNGFIPLVYRKHSNLAVFIGAQSIQKPEKYENPDATANASLAAKLPYLFACCRFAHYLKCIVRDKLGSFQNREDMELWLNKWIIQYVDGDPKHSSQITKAKRPLADAKVQVIDNFNHPGFYQAKFFLRPHYQLEGLTVSLRLVSKLPSVNIHRD